MYGFPTQTQQETIDALEVVRQLFEEEVLQSGFWHQFAMTAHSPVGLDPKAYKLNHTGPKFEGFAENDFFHEDPTGAKHEKFSEGLRVSLYNYMHGLGLEENLQLWFDFKTPKTSIPKRFIYNSLRNQSASYRHTIRIVWLGNIPNLVVETHAKKRVAYFEFYDKKQEFEIELDTDKAEWLLQALHLAHFSTADKIFLEDLKKSFEQTFSSAFESFWNSKELALLKTNGLLHL